jgi:hypothetical protein
MKIVNGRDVSIVEAWPEEDDVEEGTRVYRLVRYVDLECGAPYYEIFVATFECVDIGDCDYGPKLGLQLGDWVQRASGMGHIGMDEVIAQSVEL